MITRTDPVILETRLFAFFFGEKTCFFLKNPYLCRVKSIFCEEELF